jgi:hypothetical protein
MYGTTKTIVMRNFALILCMLAFHSWFLPAYSQDTCEVLLPGISENYEGNCRRGLAHGQGQAWGVDHYEGQFRRGLPHGLGVYTWENGNVYDGRWEEGMRHGKGTFTFYKDDEKTVLEGIWSEDEFVGHERVPAYTLGHMMNVERYRIRRRDDGNMILVTVEELGRVHPSPRNFMFHIDTGSSITVGQAVGYEGVKFPAQIKINYDMHDKLQVGTFVRVHFEVTINEPGVWEIRLLH